MPPRPGQNRRPAPARAPTIRPTPTRPATQTPTPRPTSTPRATPTSVRPTERPFATGAPPTATYQRPGPGAAGGGYRAQQPARGAPIVPAFGGPPAVNRPLTGGNIVPNFRPASQGQAFQYANADFVRGGSPQGPGISATGIYGNSTTVQSGTGFPGYTGQGGSGLSTISPTGADRRPWPDEYMRPGHTWDPGRLEPTLITDSGFVTASPSGATDRFTRFSAAGAGSGNLYIDEDGNAWRLPPGVNPAFPLGAQEPGTPTYSGVVPGIFDTRMPDPDQWADYGDDGGFSDGYGDGGGYGGYGGFGGWPDSEPRTPEWWEGLKRWNF